MLSLVYFYFFGRDRMVVGFTTTYAISAFHHWSCEFESLWWRGVLDTTVCDKVCQWLVVDRDFSLGSPVSSTNKTDRHLIAEILLKVVLNTIKTKPNHIYKKIVLKWAWLISWKTLLRYAQHQNTGKPNKLIVFGSKKSKGLKQ